MRDPGAHSKIMLFFVLHVHLHVLFRIAAIARSAELHEVGHQSGFVNSRCARQLANWQTQNPNQVGKLFSVRNMQPLNLEQLESMEEDMKKQEKISYENQFKFTEMAIEEMSKLDSEDNDNDVDNQDNE